MPDGPEQLRGRRADAAACRIVWYDTVRCDGWWADEIVYGDTTRFVLVRPDGGRLSLATTLLDRGR